MENLMVPPIKKVVLQVPRNLAVAVKNNCYG